MVVIQSKRASGLRSVRGCGVPRVFTTRSVALLVGDLGLGSTTPADDVRFQGTCGGRKHDGFDEAADGFSGFGARVGVLERLR